MKKILLTFSFVAMSMATMAQTITAMWELSDKDHLSNVTFGGEETYTSLVTATFQQGANISQTATMTGSNADANYTAVSYVPAFTTFTPATRVTAKTSGHCIVLAVTPQSGHTFKPTSISLDAAKVGTDGGNFDVYYKVGTGAETAIKTGESPLRNKIGASNTTGFSHYDYTLGDVIAQGTPFYLYLYIYNLNGADNENPKALAFRNVEVKGAVDEAVFRKLGIRLTCDPVLPSANRPAESKQE